MDKKIGDVFQTYDYSKFKYASFNRKIKLRPALLNSIKSIGLLQPITVDRNFRIADGQHRFEILRYLKLPIVYIFQLEDKKFSDQVRAMNSNNLNWNPTDYLNSFCSEDKKFYIEFRKMKNELGVTVNTLYKILRRKELGGSDLIVFKKGEFVLSDIDKLRFKKILPVLKDFYELDSYSKKAFSRTKTIDGAIELFVNPKYKHEILLKEIKKNSRNFYLQARDRNSAETFFSLLVSKAKLESLNYSK